MSTDVHSFFDFMSRFSLWGFVGRSTIALIVATVTCMACSRRSAAVRHRIWLLGLIASIVVPFVGLFAPRISLPVLLRVTSNATPSVPVESSLRMAAIPSRQFEAGTENACAKVTAPVTPVGADSTLQSQFSTLSTDPPDSARGINLEEWLILCWLAGLAFGASVFVASVIRQSLHLGRLSTIDDKGWNSAVAAAANRLGLNRRVTTMVSEKDCVPVTVGVFHARLVIPSDWDRWSPAQRDSILLHELAHIKRRDVAAQYVARAAVLLHWFNPFVWFAARQLRVERELASDDCVLQTGHLAATYAQQLLATLQEYLPRATATGVAMAHSARLDDRIKAILDPQKRREPVGHSSSVLTATILLPACILLGGLPLFSNAAAQPDGPQSNSQESVCVEQTVASSPDEDEGLAGKTTAELRTLPMTTERTNCGIDTGPTLGLAMPAE